MDLPFWDHMEELRQTLLRCFYAIGAGFILCLLAYKPIVHFLVSPLQSTQWMETSIVRKKLTNPSPDFQILSLSPGTKVVELSSSFFHLQEENRYLIPAGESITIEIAAEKGSGLILTSPLEGMTAVFKLSFWLGLAGSSPLWMWHILRFIAPALSASHQKLLLKTFFLCLSLFGLGVFVAYHITIPLANTYFFQFNQSLGLNLWSLSSYLEYTLILLLGNGLAFEAGAILLLLVQGRAISPHTLRKYRRHAIVGIFFLSAILTPPDVLSQILLAIPLMGFYEAAILYANWLDLKNNREEKMAFDN